MTSQPLSAQLLEAGVSEVRTGRWGSSALPGGVRRPKAQSWEPPGFLAPGGGKQEFLKLGPGVLGSGKLAAPTRPRSSGGEVLVAQIPDASIREVGNWNAWVLETEDSGA